MKTENMLNPVNGTASIVASQKNCNNNIFCDGEVKIKSLKLQKNFYINKIKELNEEMGINRKLTRKNVPLHIRNHFKFSVWAETKDMLCHIDKEIYELRQNSPIKPVVEFERKFMDYIEERYPKIYKEVKDELERQANKLNKEDKNV